MKTIHSPNLHKFNVNEFKQKLSKHKDKSYVKYIISGITDGFLIGNDGRTPNGNHKNIPSSTIFKNAMLKWLQKGLHEGYLYGPFSKKPKGLIISPFGAVQQTNKIRPIINMSSPKDASKGLSINETILPDMKKVKYIYLKDIVKLFYTMGSTAFGWTADCKDAYLKVPLHQSQHKYMGIHFFNLYFIIPTLMFGLASACNIYTKFADAIEYIAINENKNIFITKLNQNQILKLLNHYLDDFFGIQTSKLVL